MSTTTPIREKVAVLAPTPRDAAIALDVLPQYRIPVLLCSRGSELCSAIDDGIGAVVVLEEWLAGPESVQLANSLAAQPPWSSVPFIVLAHRAPMPGQREALISRLQNAVVLERPVKLASFLSAIRSALVARARQYELRDLLEQSRRDAEERARLQRSAEDARLRLDLLWESAQVLLGASDPETMLKSLFATIGPHLQVDLYFNFMVDEGARNLRLTSFAGIDVSEAGKIATLGFGEAVCGTVALERAPRLATYVQSSTDPMTALVRQYGVRAYVCTPLMAGERLLGTLSFASRTRDEFSADDLDFLRTIGRYVAVAYERLSLIDSLRAADQRKDEFLATLAHELRNPLAPIRQAASISKLDRITGAQLRWSHDVIERQVRHMALLLDDLLDVSRITRGKLTLRKESVDLAAVVDAAAETARPMIEGRGHELIIDLPTESLRFEGDPLRVSQVIANLLTNAAKYTDRGGGRIALVARREGDTLVIRVRDNGIGIPAHALPKLFQMFSQEKSAIERAEGGLGIGLALVKGLVELHGGQVSAQSAGQGLGSEFTVRLPVGRRAAPAHAAHAERTLVNSGAVTRRILIADDNRDAAETLGMLLKLLGHEIEVAHDGEEALERAERIRPQLALLDIGMPKLNGYEVARRIREQAWGRDVLLIAVTGWGQESDRRRALASGFDHHFTKPIEPDSIYKLLSGGSNRTQH